MELILRDAQKTDLQGIVQIYNSTIAGRMVTADMVAITVESRIGWFDAHSSDKLPLWVIQDASGNMVGWASFQAFHSRAAYSATVEISIYLDENCRGKGVGKDVLRYCIDQAPRLGAKTILGLIFAHNEPSLRLFKHFGFQEWGNLPKVAEMDNQEYGLKILGLRV
jgi:L-amino acid N-acyltransferase YncA